MVSARQTTPFVVLNCATLASSGGSVSELVHRPVWSRAPRDGRHPFEISSQLYRHAGQTAARHDHGVPASAIARQRRVTVEGAQNDKRSRIEHLLAECRTDRQRLISENAALLLRALTAEDALARLKRPPVLPLKMNVLQAVSSRAPCCLRSSCYPACESCLRIEVTRSRRSGGWACEQRRRRCPGCA
jgi:hypothetical protein